MQRDFLVALRQKPAFKSLVGKHPLFSNLLEKLKTVAGKEITVLLVGETGTGKGLCAEFIHRYGNRYDGPFIPFNCGATPSTLFESQLFGHVKGAFTGAYKDRQGLVEEANQGILFLDEVNSLDLNAQVKLNQFLETGHFRRIGENQLRQSDVRIIAASNIDLSQEVKEGRFREDLYYRLAEYEIYLPKLRERKEDIPLLVKYFVQQNSHLCKFDYIKFTDRALDQLINYDWPGNIRQLENIIKRCLVDTHSPIIDFVDLPDPVIQNNEDSSALLYSLPWKEAKKRIVATFEKKYLTNLLKVYSGVVAKCARHAGMHPPDFWKLLKKYNIKAQDYRSNRSP